MVKFIEYIAKEICQHPEDVVVKEIPGESSSILEVRVNKDDVGKMIGKNGTTAMAIRTLICSLAYKSKKRYNLEIINPNKKGF